MRTLHLAGLPEFTAERALPALTELTGEDGQGFALRASFGNAEETLEGLAAGHHDLAITTARPRGTLLTATPLCDEEHVLVAAPRWAARIGAGKLRRKGSPALENFPVVEVHEVAAARRPLLGIRLRLPPGRFGHRRLPPICVPCSPAPPRARASRCCPGICAQKPWNGVTWSRFSTRRCLRCVRTSWWSAPAHWPCRTSLGRTNSGRSTPRPTGPDAPPSLAGLPEPPRGFLSPS